MTLAQLLSLRLAAVASVALASDSATELKVLRVVPAEIAAPSTVVTVTFDRPEVTGGFTVAVWVGISADGPWMG